MSNSVFKKYPIFNIHRRNDQDTSAIAAAQDKSANISVDPHQYSPSYHGYKLAKHRVCVPRPIKSRDQRLHVLAQTQLESAVLSRLMKFVGGVGTRGGSAPTFRSRSMTFVPGESTRAHDSAHGYPPHLRHLRVRRPDQG